MKDILWTKEQCIAALNDLVEEYPDKPITRDFFRKNSDCPEYQYLRYFGSFGEFKIQAGHDFTSGQTKLLSAITKHASKDKLRELNVEKREYEGRYLKPFNNKYQTVITAGDIHSRLCDPFFRRVFIDTIARIKPEVIVLLGDIWDAYEFSNFTKDPRKCDVIADIKWVHQFLEDIREASPDSEINMIEGNHCYRLLRHLTEATPYIKILLSDLHGMSVSTLLGLDKYEVNYIARADLTVFRETDIKKELASNYLIKWDCLLFHHFPEGKKLSMPGLNGHNHKHICTPLYNPIYGSYEWHQLGAGCVRNAEYCQAEKWSVGFMISHTDTQNKRTQFEYIDLTHDFSVIGGKWYERNEDELYGW